MANIVAIYCIVAATCCILIAYITFIFKDKIKKFCNKKQKRIRFNSIIYTATKTFSINSNTSSTVSSSESKDWTNDENPTIYANFRSSKRVKGFIASTNNEKIDEDKISISTSLSSWEEDDAIYVNTPYVKEIEYNEEHVYSLPPKEDIENEYSLPPKEDDIENEYSLPPKEDIEDDYDIPYDSIKYELPPPTVNYEDFDTISLNTVDNETISINIETINNKCNESDYYDCCWVNTKELDEKFV
ncbi:EEV glycoprotein [Eptesipox virus]|uniref:EEV glycoprotein n=1 Tax=Eptesipox virus TaxID=1329402 RepID=A0A220T6J9_9POXV|nr:EEV glycoprotein [Eptesipox virus]ASK51335.1 EEV glycoprotein [Eptesipox virus]WAH71093.1 EEV glycoprotein [Eptesipox virus]